MKFKKIITQALLFSSLIGFTSCGNGTKTFISSYYAEGIDSLVYANNDTVVQLADNKQDFILLLYADCGCGGPTDSVISAFSSFIEETNLIIYAIGSSEYKKIPLSKEETFPLYPSDPEKEISDIPTLYFYSDGKLTYTQTYNSSFKSTTGISDIIYSKVLQSGYYLLNKYEPYKYETYDFYKFNLEDTSLLDEKIQNENPNILYSWYKCGDCSSLKQYLKNELNNSWNKLYLFEVDHFRNQTNKSSLWDDEAIGFPYTYEFASYRGGKVPAIVSYNNGKKSDMIIYHNDVVVNNVVQESFHEELINQTLSEEELEKYHQEKIKSYIENME